MSSMMHDVEFVFEDVDGKVTGRTILRPYPNINSLNGGSLQRN